jgi:DNA-binding NtrC family response regulator
MLSLTFQVVDDFLLTPVREEELSARVMRILGHGMDKWQATHESLMQVLGMRQLVGNDPAFASVIKMIPVIARSGLPALITGETGTGKELCARAIHHLSSRRDFPFIPCDCAAIPDHLFENEIFGHTRGAYTDAHTNQKGVVAMADGGTLFLDEVDALSLVAQAKLLRFLQEHAYRPLGAERFVQANVNVIAATNREIEDCVRDKQIRSDLYFRLNVARLKLPPLRERRGDIELLARHFLNLQPVAADVGRKAFLPATLRKLTLYDWPGNVRELLNVVQRATLLAEGQYILPEHISLPGAGAADEAVAENFRQARARAIEEFEKRYVEDLLRKHEGNVTRAAMEANKDRRAFGRLKKKYKIN